MANILVVAPAGCGKTEALAQRAAAVIRRGEVVPPNKVLGLTFSNKARDNLASRLRLVLGPQWKQWVTVSNFHGLAARVIKAHGALVGVSKNVRMPEVGWRNAQLRDLGLRSREALGAFEAALRTAKRGAASNDEVWGRLEKSSNAAALEFEQRLRSENRLDWDDLMRLGGLLLADTRVALLYRSHFGMVMVDEVQDLTLVQFEMVRAIGGDKVTYAGDPAQGIYSFAGANPTEVFKHIRSLSPTTVTFTESFRSAPAVLQAVNELASELGAPRLTCGAPEKWPDDGQVIALELENTTAEAEAVLEIIDSLLADDPSVTIGVIGRRDSRSDAIRSGADTREIAFEDWSVPTHNPRIAGLVERFSKQALKNAEDDLAAVEMLDSLVRKVLPDDDAPTLYEFSEAMAYLRELIDEGLGAEEAFAMCRASTMPGEPVAPGLHVLTGHKGKGQEFDWVFVLGMEAGHIPDFRSTSKEELDEELRVLHVMVSRARYGLVASYCRQTPTRYGWRRSQPSLWFHLLKRFATETRTL